MVVRPKLRELRVFRRPVRSAVAYAGHVERAKSRSFGRMAARSTTGSPWKLHRAKLHRAKLRRAKLHRAKLHRAKLQSQVT